MLRHILCAVMLTVFASSALAENQVTLKNGDQLSGDITMQGVSMVTLKTAYGVLEIPQSDIDVITVKGQDEIPVVSMDVPPELLPQKENVESLAPAAGEEDVLGWWGALWSGNANLGANLKTGNSETNGITIDATTKAKWEKHRAEVSVVYNREEDDGRVSVDNQSIFGAYDYYFKDKWFLENALKLEQDDIDQIDLRARYNAGLGHQFYDQDDLHLKAVAGPGYLYEEFADGTDEGDLTLHAKLDYDQKFYDDLFRTFHKSDVSVPFDEADAFLFQSKSGIRIPLKKGIIASFELGFDWDNAPAAGTTEEDASYAFKLGYEW